MVGRKLLFLGMSLLASVKTGRQLFIETATNCWNRFQWSHPSLAARSAASFTTSSSTPANHRSIRPGWASVDCLDLRGRNGRILLFEKCDVQEILVTSYECDD